MNQSIASSAAAEPTFDAKDLESYLSDEEESCEEPED